MKGIYWYYCLAVIGAGMAAYTVYRKRHIATLASTYILAISLTWLAEFFILPVLRGYDYKPGIFSDQIADSLLGHIIVNTGLWGGTAILVGTFSLGYGWIFLITVAYMLIEVLFLKLGIYEHHWWRTYMTGIAVFIYYAVFRKWFAVLNQNRHKFLRILSFYIIATFIVLLPAGVLLLLGKQHFSVGWDKNMYRDSVMFSFVYELIMGFIYLFFVCLLKKWFWKLMPLVICLISDLALIRFSILILQAGWNLLNYMLVTVVGLVIFILLARYSFKTPIKQ